MSQHTTLSPVYGIVGDGRVATHFAHYLSLLAVPFRQWSRRRAPESKLAEVIDGCQIVLLLIRDGVIEDFVREHASTLRNRRLVHFSGSLVSKFAESAHPLMTFAERLGDLAFYRRIPFVVEEGRTRFAEIFPGLPNPSYAVPADRKAHYHSLCVMSGNFTTLLWTKFFAELESCFGITRDAAIPYLEAITSNLVHSPESALTGPIARRDLGTLNANLAALRAANDPYEKIYQAFVEVHVPEAEIL
jgi:2-dehydropantoate 2-reductase